MKELEDTLCYELDSLIDEIQAIKAEEIKNEEYFQKLFGSIFYEPKPLTV